MRNEDEAETRRQLLAHLGRALEQAKLLPDREFLIYLIEMVQIEVEKKSDRLLSRWTN